jgi:hypothetical protein
VDATPERQNRLRSASARGVRAIGALPKRLSDGLPVGFVAALAALAIVAILFAVARTDQEQPRGYSEFTMFAEGCAIEPSRRRNVVGCELIGRGLYRIYFTESLQGGTPVVSRGSCCPGRIGASPESDSTVIVSVPPVRARTPIRASVVVP